MGRGQRELVSRDLPEKFAAILSDIVRQLAALDRYEGAPSRGANSQSASWMLHIAASGLSSATYQTLRKQPSDTDNEPSCSHDYHLNRYTSVLASSTNSRCPRPACGVDRSRAGFRGHLLAVAAGALAFVLTLLISL